MTLGPVSWLRHNRNIAPCTATCLALFVSVLFGAAHVRTLFLASVSTQLAALSAVVLSWQCTQLVLELLPKRRFLDAKHLPKALEPTSSLLSRLSFTFLFPLLLRGRKRPLTLDNLCAFGLPPDMTAETSGRALSDQLAHTKSRRTPGTLLRASLRPFLGVFLAPVLPKLALIAATFAQPFVVQAMLAFVSSYASEGESALLRLRIADDTRRRDTFSSFAGLGSRWSVRARILGYGRQHGAVLRQDICGCDAISRCTVSCS